MAEALTRKSINQSQGPVLSPLRNLSQDLANYPIHKRPSRLSNSSAIISTIVSTLGSGITFMPAVFNTFGILTSTLFLFFIGLITFISLYSIAYSVKGDLNNPNVISKITYSGIAARFSSKLRMCVTMTLVITSLATVFSFVQLFLSLSIQSLKFYPFIADFLNKTEMNAKMVKISILSVLSLVYFPLFKLENLSSFVFFSKLSLFCCILFYVMTVAYGVFAPYDFASCEKADHQIPKMNMGSALGTAIFAFHCQYSFPDILSSMEDQSLPNIKNMILVSTILATILYTSVGMFGYVGFGPPISNDTVLISFGNMQSFLSLSLKNRFNYTFGTFIPRFIQIIYLPIFFSGVVFLTFGIIPILQNIRKTLCSRSSIAIFLSIFTFFSGILSFKNLQLIFGVIGFLFVLPLSFLFPSIFVILSSKEQSPMRIISIFMIIFSLIAILTLFLSTAGILKF
jgi:amino acid permease